MTVFNVVNDIYSGDGAKIGSGVLDIISNGASLIGKALGL
jgi:hypothetical protein